MASASDRFKVVETALMPPGVCRVCGGASKPWYIDFGYNEEYYGAVYYCNECIAAMAEACGFLPPAARRIVEEKIQDLESRNFDLQVRTDGLEKALDGLRSAGFVVSRDPDWVMGGVVEPVFSGATDVEDPASGGTDEEQQPGAEGGTREGTAPESGGVEGVADLRPTGGVEESGDFRFTI